MKPISINAAASANVSAQEATNHNAPVSVDVQQWQQFDSSLEKAKPRRRINERAISIAISDYLVSKRVTFTGNAKPN